MNEPNIIIFGGGTGLGPVASGLKRDACITAVTPSTDRGGSSGALMADGVTELPPGDVGKALLALSEFQDQANDLYRYRFNDGPFKGHSVINMLVAAGQGVCQGDFTCGLDVLGKAMNIRGQVLTSSVDNRPELCIEREDGSITVGESAIDEQRDTSLPPIKRVFLQPSAPINPLVEQEVAKADAIVFAPGSFYTTIAPNLLVDSMPDMLAASPARKLAVINLANEAGHTTGWTAHDYAGHIEELIYPAKLDVVFINTGVPAPEILDRYEAKGEDFVTVGVRWAGSTYSAIEANLLSDDIIEPQPSDPVTHRSMMRHEPQKLARRILMECE
jgi:uncharacterized cofD-like protein